MSTLVYGSPEYNAIKEEMLKVAGVTPPEKFDVKSAISKRVKFLKDHLKSTKRKAYILGISGGVDSTTTGRLLQIACDELTKEGYPAQFIAMRLPSGIQLDEADAQEALKFINPNKTLTVNIGEAATNLSIQGSEEFKRNGGTLTDSQVDFNKGNIKARLRMVAQFQAAAMYEGLVAQTDHACEFITSFFTRFGDECGDLSLLNNVSKNQIRLMAKELGAPEKLWNKVPTADLEELAPQKTDSEGMGFEYEYLNDFVEGKQIPPEIELKIVTRYDCTRFKRDPMPGYRD